MAKIFAKILIAQLQVTNQKKFVKKLLSIHPKTAAGRKKRKKKKRKAVAKFFALQTNAKIHKLINIGF